MTLCLFEDRTHARLLPLTHLHPDFDLRCGIHTARERARRAFPGERMALHVQPQLAEVMRERSGAPVNERDPAVALFLSGTALLTPSLRASIAATEGGDAIVRGPEGILACRCSSPAFREAVYNWIEGGGEPTGMGAKTVTCDDAAAIRFPWDIVTRNPGMISLDARDFPPGVSTTATIAEGAALISPGGIAVGDDVRIGAGAVLDATHGPVVIDRGADIMHHAVIIGPAYVGAHARVKVSAKIYEGTSIGPWCKVGGEVEESILHSYANKQHEGFLGHSYLAPWTNIGADTNTSDLKNTYSPVRMTLEGVSYDTGCLFLGLIMADHAKCGINTMFNTGTSVGVGCNIFGGDYPPKFLPNFTWGGAAALLEYDIERMCDTAATVMRRRDRELTRAERALLLHVYDHTASLRTAVPQQ